MSTLGILTFTYTLWFGAYLLRRNFGKASMRYGGLGLLSFAVALALYGLSDPGMRDDSESLALMALLPSVFWCLAALHLMAQDIRAQIRHDLARLPLIVLVSGGVGLLPGGDSALILTIRVVVLSANLYGLYLLARGYSTRQPSRDVKILLTTSIFYILSAGLLILPTDLLPVDFILLLVAVDLLALGYGIVALDAYDEGESLLPDLLRSLGATSIVTLVFGGQVAIIRQIQENSTPEIDVLLLGAIASAVVITVGYDDLQRLLDRVFFRHRPQLQAEREQLRAAAGALPRQLENSDIMQVDAGEFTRLTRRALSAMNSLNRLAASPLMQLPQIEQHNTLDRAAELKRLLTEAILSLKPQDKGTFGTTDEWRHFNALYYPYVAGLKPFSRRNDSDTLSKDEREALDWFQRYVPERTLYNWQNEAAELIALHLREGMHA